MKNGTLLFQFTFLWFLVSWIFFRGALLEYLSGDPYGISPMQRRGFVWSFIIHVNLRLLCARQLQQGIGQTPFLLQSQKTAVCVSGGGCGRGGSLHFSSSDIRSLRQQWRKNRSQWLSYSQGCAEPSWILMQEEKSEILILSLFKFCYFVYHRFLH